MYYFTNYWNVLNWWPCPSILISKRISTEPAFSITWGRKEERTILNDGVRQTRGDTEPGQRRALLGFSDQLLARNPKVSGRTVSNNQCRRSRKVSQGATRLVWLHVWLPQPSLPLFLQHLPCSIPTHELAGNHIQFWFTLTSAKPTSEVGGCQVAAVLHLRPCSLGHRGLTEKVPLNDHLGWAWYA